ncbi:MAG: hypothetical protein NT016_03960 [Candidatus Aenigmarchaeota archaeon]|nr:hypothetical protein [Candidatus Aenigmarchaeota archaeon]
MIDDLILKKLILLKLFFEHGKNHSRYDTKLDNMFAIHHFDLCNEFILRILSDYLKIDIDKLVTMENIYDCINKNLEKNHENTLTMKKEVLRVRQLRNDIQHLAETKTRDSVDESFVWTKNFLSETTKTIFEIDFDTISLSDLIKDDRFKTEIKKSEKFLEEGKICDALTISDSIFESRLGELKRIGYKPSGMELLGSSAMDGRSLFPLYGIDPWRTKDSYDPIWGLKSEPRIDNEELQKVKDEILSSVNNRFSEYTKNIIDVISIFGMGVNYIDYSAFKRIIQMNNTKQDVQVADAKFAVEFVTYFLINH